MITVYNMHEKTAQEVFEYVVDFMLTQDAASTNPDGLCLYRNAEGKKCAAGCLIPDESYDPEIESVRWSEITDSMGISRIHMELILQLQSAHDVASRSYMTRFNPTFIFQLRRLQERGFLQGIQWQDRWNVYESSSHGG